MKPEDAIALYLDHQRQRHLSVHSVAYAGFLLQHLGEYCQIHDIADLRDATLETLLDYYRWIRQKKRPDGKTIATLYVNNHIRVARALFRLLADRQYVMSDISKDFPPLHDPKTLPRGILTPDQVMQLLRQPLTTTPLGFRDRAMLELLYSTAIRGGEICKITLYDFDPRDRMLRVNGKGGKDRVVPVGKVAAGYLAEYIKTVRPILAEETQNDWLFLSASGHRLSPNDLQRLVRSYREKAHLPVNITTHSMRHTCATEMLKGGASIRHVQELLGHADIQTTQVYTHVVPSDLKKAHARTAPSERRKSAGKVEFTASGGVVCWNDKRNAEFWPKLRARHGRKC